MYRTYSKVELGLEVGCGVKHPIASKGNIYNYKGHGKYCERVYSVTCPLHPSSVWLMYKLKTIDKVNPKILNPTPSVQELREKTSKINMKVFLKCVCNCSSNDQ